MDEGEGGSDFPVEFCIVDHSEPCPIGQNELVLRSVSRKVTTVSWPDLVSWTIPVVLRVGCKTHPQHDEKNPGREGKRERHKYLEGERDPP